MPPPHPPARRNHAHIRREGHTDTAIKHGTAGADTLAGTTGADQLFSESGSDVLRGLAGPDTLDGRAGRDTADYSVSAAGVVVQLEDGDFGINSDAFGEVYVS